MRKNCSSPRCARPFILVAGSGHQLLSPAGREADIIAIDLPPDASEATAERVSWLAYCRANGLAGLARRTRGMAAAVRSRESWSP